MADLERVKALREELNQASAEIKDQVTTEMASIAGQINELVKQGVEMADASGLTFDLSSLDFLPYGAGGLQYLPKGAGRNDYYGYGSDGWQSSSSSC